jgi:acyl-CoA synthetase (NDP forming)
VDIDRQAVIDLLKRAHSLAGGWLSAEDSFAVLQAYGIPTPPQVLAETKEQALSAAEALGLGRNGKKIVLKIASPDIVHKSDVGGVLLDIADPGDLLRGYEAILQRARASQPQARILGVHLQPMIEAGQEVILGVIQDAQFGPLVMFGSGGVEVEGLKDIAFGIAPLPSDEARQMIASTWAGRKLQGFRSITPVDEDAVLDALLRLAWLAVDFPQLAEVEINPLRVLAHGAFAIDARIRMAQPKTTLSLPHLVNA